MGDILLSLDMVLGEMNQRNIDQLKKSINSVDGIYLDHNDAKIVVPLMMKLNDRT